VARQRVDTLWKEEHVAVANGRGARGGVWAAFFGVTTPFHFGSPTIGFAAILSMVLVMLVTTVKTTGNAVAVDEIVDKPIREDNLTAGLRADGFPRHWAASSTPSPTPLTPRTSPWSGSPASRAAG
jgi:xanthine/uracil permease